MELRQLGRSELFVSTLTFGSVTFSGGTDTRFGSSDLGEARSLFARAVDAGINLVDTADSYHNGVAEEIVGELLKSRPGAMMVSTKVGFPMGSTQNDRGLGRRHILQSAENSLRRLQVDCIDLYHLHMWDGLVPVEETLTALDELTTSGKIRYLAVSNFSAWHTMKYLGIAELHDFPRPVAQQIHYTPHVRDPEFELLPLAADQGLGTLVWSPLAGGLLSGKYRRNQPPPPGSRHTTRFEEPPVPDEERLFDIVDALVDVGSEHGVGAAQVTIAYTLSRPGVTSVIIGARRPEQLDDNIGGAGLVLTAEQIDRIERVSRPAAPYPYWHQLSRDLDRLGPAELPYLTPYLA